MSSRVLEVFARILQVAVECSSSVLSYRRNFSHECLKTLQIEFSESSDLKHNFLSSGLDWPCLLHSRVESGLKRRINTLEAHRKHDVLKRRHLLPNKKNAGCENLRKTVRIEGTLDGS